jgi:large subunit ribosomal protein L15
VIDMKFKRKKNRRKRGSTFHGWGRGAAHHKGAGNRGGRGRAGTGKKADQNKPSYWTEPVGKHGFNSQNRFHITSINICDLVRDIDKFVAKEFAANKGNGFEIDLGKAGYDKLLGTGDSEALKVALFITVDYASKGAVEKIKKAGGSVNVLKVKVKKEKKNKAEKKPEKKKSAGKAEDAEEEQE